MLPKVLVIAGVILLAVFAFKNRLPSNSSPGQPQQIPPKQESKNLSFDEVLNLGGTCFNNPFIDETKDVEAALDGEGRTKAPDKDEYDINRIAIGRDGENLVSMWEFVGEIATAWRNDHNITIQTYHDTDKPEDDRFEVIKDSYSQEWNGRLISGTGQITSFNPQVKLTSKAIQFVIPYNLITQDGVVDGLAFVANFYNKPIKTMYSDTVWPPANQRVKGHYTSFYCPKK